MLPFIKITRPVNLVFLAFTMLGLILLGNKWNDYNQIYAVSNFWIGLLLILILCTMFAAGYVINDWFDVETDKLNKSEKQIVDVQISRKQTLIYYIILVVVCTLLTLLLIQLTSKYWLFSLVTLMQLILFIYSQYLKKTLLFGNFVVANFLALPYFLIAYVFNFFEQEKTIVLVLFTLANSTVMLNMLREIAKDWEDLKGDLKIEAKTFVIRYGEDLTKDLLKGLLVFSMISHLMIILIWLYFKGLNQFIFAAWPLLFALVLHIPFFIGLGKSQWTASQVSKRLKLLMLIGVIWVYYLWIVG